MNGGRIGLKEVKVEDEGVEIWNGVAKKRCQVYCFHVKLDLVSTGPIFDLLLQPDGNLDDSMYT